MVIADKEVDHHLQTMLLADGLTPYRVFAENRVEVRFLQSHDQLFEGGDDAPREAFCSRAFYIAKFLRDDLDDPISVAEDAKTSPREMATFNKDEVFVGGNVRSADGEEWLQLVKRIPTSSLRSGRALQP